MKTSKFLILGMLAASLVILAATPAGAAEYDLTTDPTGLDSVTINGAIWEIFQSTDPTGSGVWHAFFRVQKNGTERGYNTDGRPLQFDELKSATFTHSALLADVPIIYIGGVPYREFQLDINEQAGGTNYYISLDRFQVWTTNNPNLLGYDEVARSFAVGTAQLVYDLDVGPDGDSVIKMDYRANTGSGKRDYRVYVPNSNFAGKELSNVVIFTRHGDAYSTDDGFEEWGVAVYEIYNPAISITKSADVPSFCLSEAPYPVTYTYLVENTGDEDLENVDVTDDTCGSVTGPTGDDGDGLLNPLEVWTYTCSTNLSGTTTNTGTVVAYGVTSGAMVTDSDSATVTAYDVAVEVDPSEETICEGDDPVQFCAVVTLGSGNYSYSWTKDGGAPFATTQCVTVGEAGEYCVTVTDTVTGCEDTACATLTVVSPPVCSIDGPDEVCEGDTGIVFCSLNSADSYSWGISGNGTIIGPTNEQCVTVDAGGPGSFTLTLEVCNGPVELDCCSQCEQVVTVNPCLPGILVEKVPDIEYFCLSDAPYPVTYTYTVTATGDEDLENVDVTDDTCSPLSRQADDPGNDDDVLELGEVWVYTCSTNLSDTTTNTVDAVGYGVFSGAEVTSSDTATVTAYDVAVEVDPSEAAICEVDDDVELCAVVTGGVGPFTYSWTKDGGAPFAATQCITVSSAGLYCVTVTDTATGCEDDACGTVRVIEAPDCTINSGPRSLCDEDIGTPVQYCSGAVADGYEWDIISGPATIDGADNGQCVNIIPNALGTIVLELQIWNDVPPDGACGDSCQIEIVVEECGGTFCTFTQGFWGNQGGKACGLKTSDLIDALLLQDGPVLVGGAGNQISLETSECIIDLLPAGGTPGPIDPAGDYYCDEVGDNLDPDLLNKQGRFDNVLIGQVVALTLNLRLYDYGCTEDVGDLAAWHLPAEFCTMGKNGCPEHFTIPESLVDSTVQELLDLANLALAGDTTYSIADIYKAVTAINEGFDECREVISCPTQEVCDNGCDDDFDGLVDGDDIVDCPPPIILP